jgi:signal transduction histidine kinase
MSAALVNAGQAIAGSEYQQLMSDTFHELSQPLSTATCLLEITLASRFTKQSRRNLQIALQQIQSIVRLFSALRELVRFGNTETAKERQIVPLNVCLRDVVEDLRPVAESAGVELSMASTSDCLVYLEASGLRQALYHLLGYALDSSASGAEMKITVGDVGEEADVEVEVSNGRSDSHAPAPGTPEMAEWKRHKLEQRLGLAIAGSIFENGGGSLRMEDDGTRLWLRVRLPLAAGSMQL